MDNSIPWVEKYRPQMLDDIVLKDEHNTIIRNMIDNDNYSNMIFYGPPGTGKTTTIMCFMNAYKQKHNSIYTDNYICLNASHERGVKVIRGSINNFIHSKNIYDNNKRFVILDEVDSMTKQAQFNLYNLIVNCKTNVVFIFICNYFHKLIYNIRNSMVVLHFSQTSYICDNFINKCIKSENIKVPKNIIESIKENNVHDLRAIINNIQRYSSDKNILTNEIMETIITVPKLGTYMKSLIQQFDFHELMTMFFNYIYDKEYVIDETMIEYMKLVLIINKNDVDFFVNELIPYFKFINN